MSNSEKEFLDLFGWDDFFENQISNSVIMKNDSDRFSSLLFPARVICEERNLYRLQAGVDHLFWASVRGKLSFTAEGRVDYPAVGDWVMVELPAQTDRGQIHQVLRRKSTIHRKQVGSSVDQQILSTNVDTVFVTTSANSDLNFRRIERYLTLIYDAGCTPVILLTKSDMYSGHLDQLILQTQNEFPHVEVYALSKDHFEKADFLKKYLKKGTTSVLMGSSGVGKSTLVNFLIGEEKLKTQEVRDFDGKGRHTTTSRNLYVSRYEGLIIDTPGMRELQLSDHVEGVQSQFSDIEDLVLQCRFKDCQHQTEPDCALQNALEKGLLSFDRWQSYQKIVSEIRYVQRKQDKVLASADRKKWKKISLQARKNGYFRKGGR